MIEEQEKTARPEAENQGLAREVGRLRNQVEDLEFDVHSAETAADEARADALSVEEKARSLEEALLEIRNELQVLERAARGGLAGPLSVEETVRALAVKADAAYWSV